MSSENLALHNNADNGSSEKIVKSDKYLLCITEAEGQLGLESYFYSVQRISDIKGLLRLVDTPCSEHPDAVVYYINTVSEEVLGNIRYAKEICKSCSTPLVIVSKEISNEEKKDILKNGADDCFTNEINPESLNYWIDFLKMFKRISREETLLQIEPFNFKVSFWKRLFDIAVSGIALIMLSPILLVIAMIIKLESRGPVFYVSKRAGSGYKTFNFVKFRSMSQGADKELNKLMHLNQYGGGDVEVKDKSSNPVFYKIKDDPRITRFGKFLRNTSLDELPQLINVLKGDMSIVGNRPLPLYEAQRLTKDQCAMRFMAAAGITGLWQVSKRGRAEMSEEERIDLDIQYANQNSLFYDFKLILKTIPALFQEEAV